VLRDESCRDDICAFFVRRCGQMEILSQYHQVNLYQGQNRLYGFGSGFFESKIKSKFVA
jgi:hypothetical protein